MPLWLYVEVLIIATLISGFMGSLNLPTALVAAAAWLAFNGYIGWLQPTDPLAWLMVVLPALAPFVGHAIGKRVRKRFAARDAEAADFAERRKKELEGRRAAAGLYVAYLTIAASDVERSAGFYRDVLRLKPAERPPFVPEGIWLESRALRVLLVQRDVPVIDVEMSPQTTHTVFETKAFDDFVEHLSSLGYNPQSPEKERQVGMTTSSDGHRHLYLRDPDRQVIAIYAEPKPAPAAA
jgi:catechol 2,3-dioxygenase-like lactoylglutathione lyase family enzyme